MNEPELTVLRHFEVLLAEKDKLLVATKEDLDRRLEGMNHLQAAMNKMGEQMIPRPEFVAFKEAIERDMRALFEFRATLEGKASQWSVSIAMFFSAVGVLVGVAAIVLRFIK